MLVVSTGKLYCKKSGRHRPFSSIFYRRISDRFSSRIATREPSRLEALNSWARSSRSGSSEYMTCAQRLPWMSWLRRFSDRGARRKRNLRSEGSRDWSNEVPERDGRAFRQGRPRRSPTHRLSRLSMCAGWPRRRRRGRPGPRSYGRHLCPGGWLGARGWRSLGQLRLSGSGPARAPRRRPAGPGGVGLVQHQREIEERH